MADSLPIRYTDEFRMAAREVTSVRFRQHLRKVIEGLQTFPDMGSPQPRRMLRDRYGDGIRTVAVDGYPLVYRHDDEALWLISLPWGGIVK